MIMIYQTTDPRTKEIIIKIIVPYRDMQDANIDFVDDEKMSDKIENIKRIALYQEENE